MWVSWPKHSIIKNKKTATFCQEDFTSWFIIIMIMKFPLTDRASIFSSTKGEKSKRIKKQRNKKCLATCIFIYLFLAARNGYNKTTDPKKKKHKLLYFSSLKWLESRKLNSTWTTFSTIWHNWALDNVWSRSVHTNVNLK